MPDNVQAVPAVSFTSAAHEHVEPAFTLTLTPTTAVQQVNPIDIPAYGYMRNIYLDIQATGGTGGTLAADGPWNCLQSVALQDVNGGNIVGPMDGYALYAANVFGAYAYRNNPADSPDYLGTGANFSCYMRVPVEISHRDGLGSLANQNSAANYKLALALNSVAAIWSAAPSPLPTITIRGFLEAWTIPTAQDSKGRPQAQTPPLLGTGQYWSSRVQSGIVVGANTIPATRLGNYVRSFIFIARNASGVRDDTVFPDPFQQNWDGIQLRNQSQRYARQEIYEKVGGTFTRPAGVFVLPYNHGGAVASLGDENPDLWLPTTQSSRLELTGVSATAGSIQTLTNEVAPIEQDQTQRYVLHNQDGDLAAPTAVAR